MAAGQGFKTFVTGEVLTAGDVNGYLMQGINVFTNATARDAAITAPAEGQFAFTKDNNSLWYYDGAAWVASGATGDIEGVTAGVGISGGGTSGTVTVTNSMATAIDAKGDLVPGTGADTFARLAVGANGTILTADSAEATGLKWATPAAGGGITLISTTAITATASVDLTSIPQTYKDLVIVVDNAFENSGAQQSLTFNNGTSLYSFVYMQAANANNVFVDTSTSAIRIAGSLRFVAGSGSGSIVIRIPNYASTTMAKNCTTNGYGGGGTTFGAGGVGAVAAITSAKITWGGTPSAQGNVLLYGVN